MGKNENEAKVQELWRQGMIQKDICKELGLSKSAVSMYVQRAPEYVKPEPKTDNHSHWTLGTEASFNWRWPFTINQIRRACGLEPLPVPEHDVDEEKEMTDSRKEKQEETEMTTGEKIKAIRKRKGFTQAELADKSGITRGMIQQYESGTRIPKITFCVKIADALGCNITDLVDTKSAEQDVVTRANEYQTLAARTINPGLSQLQIESHALHGLSGEVGELHSLYQKMYQGHEFDAEHAMKETGDILWMIAEYCTAMGWNLEDVMQLNIDKLKARYPEGFSVERSEHRKDGDV